MKLIIHRTMRLGGQRYEAGDTVDVPEADAELALRHGWAGKPTKVVSPAKAKGGKTSDESAGESGQGD